MTSLQKKHFFFSLLCIGLISGCALKNDATISKQNINIQSTLETEQQDIAKGGDFDNEISVVAKSFLPKNGIMIISAGLMSSGTRTIIDFDQKTLSYSIAGKNTSPYDESLETKKIYLSDTEIKTISDLINQIQQSKKDFMNKEPIADYDLLLFMNKNGSLKIIDSYGPPLDEVKELDKQVTAILQNNTQK